MSNLVRVSCCIGLKELAPDLTLLAKHAKKDCENTIADAIDLLVVVNRAFNKEMNELCANSIELPDVNSMPEEELKNLRSQFSIYKEAISVIDLKEDDAKALFFNGLKDRITIMGGEEVHSLLGRFISLL